MISDPEAPHLAVDQAHGIGVGVIGAERVGADEFGEPIGPMRLCATHRPHLVQHHGHAGFGDLEGGLTAGEAAADDVNGLESVEVIRAF